MKVQDLSDADICKALRCCTESQCKICPSNEPKIVNCLNAINLEAARRLEHLTEIRAQRDAYKKQLQKLGMKI